MNNYDIVILETWDKETIEIKINIEDWLNLKSETKLKGEDGIYIKDLQRFIKFSNIKDEKGKTNYIALEAPKQTKEPTQEEIKIKANFLRDIHKKTYESRRKKFIETRKQILSDLAKKEIEYGLEVTEKKLEEYNLLKIENATNKKI